MLNPLDRRRRDNESFDDLQKIDINFLKSCKSLSLEGPSLPLLQASDGILELKLSKPFGSKWKGGVLHWLESTIVPDNEMTSHPVKAAEKEAWLVWEPHSSFALSFVGNLVLATGVYVRIKRVSDPTRVISMKPSPYVTRKDNQPFVDSQSLFSSI